MTKSGEWPSRHLEIPITIDQKCMAHQTDEHDINITMKLFKMACLAYKPGKIEYRHQTLDRNSAIRVRRGIIDKIESIVANCDLFSKNAMYPRRYFDDLMCKVVQEQQQQKE